jgi:Ni/Fe-hydrogenase 1 B-type cytochrome subunit
MSGTNSTFSSFNETHSLALRIWHWTTFAVITFTIILVLMGTFMFKTRDNIGLVKEQLERKGATVTNDQARAVSHEYSDKIWMLHKYVGYCLSFLLLCRLIIEVAQPNDEKTTVKLKRALGFEAKAGPEKDEKNLYLFVKRGYVLFYLLFLTMALSGLVLAFEDVAFLDPIHDAMKTIHEYTQYTIYTYIIVHLIGVVVADIGNHPGLVSGMIHGKKR